MWQALFLAMEKGEGEERMRSFIAKSDTSPVWMGSRNLKMSFGASLVLIWCLINMKKALEGAGAWASPPHLSDCQPV